MSVDPASVAVWRWYGVGAACALGTALAVAMIKIALLAPLWYALAVVVACGASLAVGWWYPGACYRHLSYALDETGISVSRGVVWRTTTLLPVVRIQHTDVAQGPLERRYGIATLKLYTAGSRYTRTQLPGLAEADAKALRDRLQPGEEHGRDAV